MKKKLLILILVVGIIVISLMVIINYDKKKSYEIPTIREEKQQTNIEPEEIITENPTTEVKEEIKDESSIKSNSKSNKGNNNDNRNISNNDVISDKNNSQNNNNPKSNVVTQPPVQQTTTQPETPKQESGPWVALGISKDQYENKPMMNWERVDYPTRNSCATAGDEWYSQAENGKARTYSCHEVMSYTRSLGWMLIKEEF